MKRDSEDSVIETKLEMRRSMRFYLSTLEPAYRAEASLVICGLAARLPVFRAAACVALFAPLASEPDIHPLIEEAWAEGKRVVLPRMRRENDTPQLDWHAVTEWAEVIETGPFGLREPDPEQCPQIADEEVGCVFVPGLAFDLRGMRLGRGGGYYDRFLGGARPDLPAYGLMFTGQRVPRLPSEAHDQALRVVMTEDGPLCFR
jgi:5-formyltetrahydrofolate cyclo-ligase